MKAIRLLKYGGQLVFQDVPAPTIGPDQVLVKIKSTAINHLDLVEASGSLKQILPIRELYTVPGAAAIGGDADTAVIGNHQAVAVQRVDPQVVIIGARKCRCIGEGLASVERPREGCRHEVDLILVVGRYRAARVVSGAALQLAIRAHQVPTFARIVGFPELALLGGSAVPRHAVAGLDHGVHAAGTFGDGDGDLAHRRIRKAVAAEPPPGGAAIGGFVETAARSAAGAGPRVHFQLPHTGEENARVAGVHRKVGAAGVLAYCQHLLPGFAAVGGAVDAALRLRPVSMAERTGEDDLGVARVRLQVLPASRDL
jgi:hypothetical protein